LRRRPVPRAELINGTKDTKFETPVLGRNLHSVTPKKQSKKEPTLGEELNGTYTPKTGNKIETPEVSPKDEFSKKTKRGSKELSSEISEYLDKKLGYGFSTEVERVAKNVGVNAKDLVAIMAAESGLNPNAGKGKNAVGLFQFTSSEVLAESGGKLSWAYNANSGLDLNRDGKITKSELAQHAEKMVKQNGEEFYDLYMLG